MLHQVLSWMYERPMWLYWGVLAVVLALWGVLGCVYGRHRLWIRGNVAVSSLMIAAILCITLVLRGANERGVILSPTALLESAKLYPDVYIQMQLNAILFVPLGATLPYGMFVKTKHPIVWTVVTATVLSVAVECGQYLFSKGYSEWMDVLLNMSGAVVGVTAYMLTMVITKYHTKKEDHERS